MNYRKTKSGVPILSKKEIEDISIKFLCDFDNSLITKSKPVPIEDIIEGYLELEMDYKTLDKNNLILGLTAFNNGYLTVFNPDLDQEEWIEVTKGTIIINNHLVEDEGLEGRYRFTCSHEVSHWILHRHKFEENEKQLSLFDDYKETNTIKCLSRNIENIFGYSGNYLQTDEDWLEWQADYMGGAILLPKPTIQSEFLLMLKQLGLRDKYVYSDLKIRNNETYNSIINELSNLFKVSKKAIEVRLHKLDLIKNRDNQLSFITI